MSAAPEDWLPTPPSQASNSIAVGWKSRLLLGSRGGVLAVVANAIMALRHAPEWHDVLKFNESSFDTVAVLAPPFECVRALPFVWADEHDVLTAAWLQHQGIGVNKDIASQAVHAVARKHSFHPIREYLESIKWDGVERIDNWLTLYLGASASAYARAISAKFLIGAVARIYRPGVKNDHCPILEGPQGARKSTALRTLAGTDFFTDDIADLGSKDSVMQTRGIWIIELSELDAMTRSDLARVKAFMSRQVDRIRPPYGRRVIEARRECVFVGTVNKETYLKDETGGRRFWPIKCGSIKLAELERDRDQLWAEARERFRAGETWWLDSQELVQSAAEFVAARYEVDPWDDLISKWVTKPSARADQGQSVVPLTSTTESVTVQEILIHCIGKRPDSWTQTDQTRVARSLTAMGWKRHQKRVSGRREWRYSLSPASAVSPVESQ